MRAVRWSLVGMGAVLGLSLLELVPAAAQEAAPAPPQVRLQRIPVPAPEATPTSEPSAEPTPAPALPPATIRRPAPSAPPIRTATQPAPAPPPVVRPFRMRPVQVRTASPTPILISPAAIRQTEIVRPAAMSGGDVPGSVTMRRSTSSAVMRALPVVRRYQLPQLRANPIVTLGSAQLNLSPVFDNPQALPNVAQRVRAAPDLAVMISDDLQITEVSQGLVIRSFMTYRINPGTCTDSSRRARLAQTGLACAKALPLAARPAAFSNPADPHYVADPAMRAEALAAANAQSAKLAAELDNQVKSIRAALADPAQRANFDAELGPGTADRLDAMSDDQLKTEIVNSGDTSIEQVLFVPKALSVNPAFGAKFNFTAAPSSPPEPETKTAVSASAPIADHIYLTGFTMGKDYEWSMRIEKSIKMCVLGCKTTYYAEVHAGFNYALGLRFPVTLGGTYSYDPDPENPANATASLRADYHPINGSPQDYSDAGLDQARIYDGKEFVAQFSAHAGAGYSLPFAGSANIDIPVEFDFTTFLEDDFKDGQFTPPVPGSGTGPSMDKVFTDIDLIGGAGNFGVVGAQVFPAVKIMLVSDSLTFTVHDYQNNTDTVISTSGQKIPLGIRAKDQSSSFSIGDPTYSLGLNVTPGINARLFVDVAVWSHNWDFPVWFPQLSLTIPAEGVAFGCHAGTACKRRYVYSPNGHVELEAAEAGFDTDLANWGDAFEARYIGECADETCQFGIRFIRQGRIYGARHKHDANPALTIQDKAILDYLGGADAEAKSVIDDSQKRQTTNAAKSFGTFWTLWWSKQCSDKICLDKVKAISFLAQLEAVSQQNLNPDMSTNEVIGMVGKKFAPVFEAEIKASKARVAAEEAAQKARVTSRTSFVPVRIRTQ
ncbi:MAG: hypothetical protein ABL914_06140 [Novosphingobium sp.]|uniref:hypothetical protein n=1 Tax=Novosphingobium sp. TaxID=1874826 RepID=UPI0032BAC0B0